MTTKISQIKSVGVTTTEDSLPDFPTRGSQIKAVGTTTSCEALPVDGPKINQVRATGINTTTADLADDVPPTYSEIGQVRAVGVSGDSEPQPQFASYLTQ